MSVSHVKTRQPGRHSLISQEGANEQHHKPYNRAQGKIRDESGHRGKDRSGDDVDWDPSLTQSDVHYSALVGDGGGSGGTAGGGGGDAVAGGGGGGDCGGGGC